MTIKTKYNRGDRVWVIHENAPVACMISDICAIEGESSVVFGESCYTSDYQINKPVGCIKYTLAWFLNDGKLAGTVISSSGRRILFPEIKIFKSKQALLKSLL